MRAKHLVGSQFLTYVMTILVSCSMVCSGIPVTALAEALTQDDVNSSLNGTEPVTTDGTDVKSNKDSENVTVEEEDVPAKWQVTFDTNGGTGEPVVMDVTEGETVLELGTVAYQRDGYQLVGWSTRSDNKDVKDDNGTVVEKNHYAPSTARLFDLSYLYVSLNDDEAKNIADVVKTPIGWIRLMYDVDGIRFENRTVPGSLLLRKVIQNATDASENDEFDLGVRLLTPTGFGLGDVSVQTRDAA